jgi:hypothetical protein
VWNITPSHITLLPDTGIQEYSQQLTVLTVFAAGKKFGNITECKFIHGIFVFVKRNNFPHKFMASKVSCFILGKF